LDPIVYFNNKKLYPRELIDTITRIGKDLNDVELFNNTALYRKVLIEYLFNFRFERTTGYRDSCHLNACYNFCRKFLVGKLKDYVLSDLLIEYIKYDSTHLVKKIYPDYLLKSQHSEFGKYVDSIYKIYVLNTSLTPKDVFDIVFEDSTHHKILVRDIFRKSFLFVDCWATWCVPCRKQIPYLDTIVSEYKNKIQFISLSVDQDIRKWDSWINKSSNKNIDITPLLAPKGFENIFFRRLGINEIPRYILISKTGEIMENSLPNPSERKELENRLNQYFTK
jgi:thiol-disulfide isomerase/thioredoxin